MYLHLMQFSVTTKVIEQLREWPVWPRIYKGRYSAKASAKRKPKPAGLGQSDPVFSATL
jgi:hypothetical protein